MTPEHFEAIASIIKYNRDMNYPADKSGYGLVAAKLIAVEMADYFEKENPLFNRSRFLTACGIND